MTTLEHDKDFSYLPTGEREFMYEVSEEVGRYITTDEPDGSEHSFAKYIREDLVQAAVSAAYEDAAVAMGEFHWNRYRTREQGGELSAPAVFSSHTHQAAMDICRSRTLDDAKAALERVKREARNGALREALSRCKSKLMADECCGEIQYLIEKDTTDD